MSDLSDQRNAYDFEKHAKDRRAEVTLCLANPPERNNDDRQDFLNRLLDAAGPDGWRWSVLQIVDPAKAVSYPKNGERLVKALDDLIAKATAARENVMSFSEITNEDFWTWQIEDAWNEVQNADEELPEPDEEDEDE